MFAFHKDTEIQYQQVYWVSREYILPFIERWAPELRWETLSVLDLGFGEGGLIKALAEKGARVTGIELDPNRLQRASQHLQPEINAGKVQLLLQDIYTYHPESLFDLIVLKDVIEHIPNQERLIPVLVKLMKPGGYLWFGFPPWQMPFGGHQQMIDRPKWLSLTPYFHLLPAPIYEKLLTWAKVHPSTRTLLMEIKSTGISTGTFEKLVRQNHLHIVKRVFYLLNPIYRYKFGLTPIHLPEWTRYIPWWIRDFWTTGVYYLVQKRK
jgi:SAM-dependent methyltransferase